MENTGKKEEISNKVLFRPLLVNLGLILLYGFGLRILGRDGGGGWIYLNLIVIQALINGVLFIVYLFIRASQALVYLLSTLIVLMVGLSICAAVFGGFLGRGPDRKIDMDSLRALVIKDSTRQADSIRNIRYYDSLRRADSLTNPSNTQSNHH